MRSRRVAVTLLALVVGTFALTASACSSDPPDTPAQDWSGYRIDENDLSTFTTELPSGRKVECLAVTYRGSALQCWEVHE